MKKKNSVKTKVKVSSPKATKKSTSKKDTRPSWDEYFMSLATIVGSRGTCDRGRAGCVIVKDKRILTTGYVGAPVGLPHCDEAGHEMHQATHENGEVHMHCVRTIHAEQNAVAQAAKMGVSIDGATIYCKMIPCYICAKILINAGIKRIVAQRDYHATKHSKKIFKEAKIDIHVFTNEMETYTNM